ncbi:MAG: hypothetical protein ACO1QS_17600 [Verrucomicrobiota bacterium]
MIKSTGAVVVPTPSTATNELAAADIRGIRPLVDVPLGWEWLTWTVVGLIGAVVLYRLWVLWRNRPPSAPPRPRISPEQKAHQQLDAALRLLMEPKVFCSTVSDAVRVYLEDRFRFRAPERTTEEFLSELQKSPRLNDEQKKTLADFLERCDLVKFARFEPAETELKQLHSVAHRLVDETKPQAMMANAPMADSEEEAAKRAARFAANEVLEQRFLRCVIAAVLVSGFGLQMFAWSEVAFAPEPLVSQSGFGWHTFKYMAEALWSRPVGVAIMVLGLTYFVEALLCKARRSAV